MEFLPKENVALNAVSGIVLNDPSPIMRDACCRRGRANPSPEDEASFFIALSSHAKTDSLQGLPAGDFLYRKFGLDGIGTGDNADLKI